MPYFLKFLPLFLILISSCSSLNKFAVNSSSDLLYKASSNLEKENNLDMFKNAVPANLKLLESLLSQSPKNEELLALLVKGYAGYAFIVNETEYLEKEWEEKNSGMELDAAILNYSKALEYGKRYLALKNVYWEELEAKYIEPNVVLNLLDKRLKSEKMDLESVLFFAQSLASIINLQKDNMQMIALLPLSKSLFDWVCMKSPNINFGTCDIFFAGYESSRPKMLGGNPEKGKELFEKAMEKYPHNWLIRSSFAQFSLIPSGDQERFEKEVLIFNTYQDEFRELTYFSPKEKSFKWSLEPRLRIYQSLALKRFQLMKKYKNKLF